MSVFDEPYVKMTRSANNEDWNNDLPGEIWKDIPGYEGMYQFSNKDRVRSLERVVERNIDPDCNPKSTPPYRKVPGMVLAQDRMYTLNKNNIREQFSVKKLRLMVPFRRTKQLFHIEED